MWNTFKVELKNILRPKWKLLAFVILLFIPFVYGFLYMNAYWAPFKHVDKLDIIIVNLDDTKLGSNSQNLEKNILKANKNGVKFGTNTYNVHIQDSHAIYKTIDEVKESVYAGKHMAAIVIPIGYSKSTKNLKDNINTKNKSLKLKDIFNLIEQKFPVENRVHFFNSYKNNYLAGEMTNFGAGIAKLSIDSLLNTSDPIIKFLIGGIKNLKLGNSLISNEKIGGNINTYGKGLSPYFISIALWAGALTMTFIIKNERLVKKVKTWKHYFGKSLMWILTGWIQSFILVTAISIQGVVLEDSWSNQWELYLFAGFTSMIFTLIVQGVSYSLRYGDIGEFLVVILLVLQLISSSGTFPVEMQAMIFKIIHPVAPFTYTINVIREMLFEPSTIIIFKNIGILLLFPIIIIPISLIINTRWDNRNSYTMRGTTYYKSYEVHMGDM